MKRTLAITAATAMLVLSLAGCGAQRYDNAYGNADNTRAGTLTTTDTMHNADETGLGGVTGAVNRAARSQDAYTAVNNGGITANGGKYADEASIARAAREGDRYARMLENARVHDSDGFLLDGENASYRTY